MSFRTNYHRTAKSLANDLLFENNIRSIAILPPEDVDANTDDDDIDDDVIGAQIIGGDIAGCFEAEIEPSTSSLKPQKRYLKQNGEILMKTSLVLTRKNLRLKKS